MRKHLCFHVLLHNSNTMVGESLYCDTLCQTRVDCEYDGYGSIIRFLCGRVTGGIIAYRRHAKRVL